MVYIMNKNKIVMILIAMFLVGLIITTIKPMVICYEEGFVMATKRPAMDTPGPSPTIEVTIEPIEN